MALIGVRYHAIANRGFTLHTQTYCDLVLKGAQPLWLFVPHNNDQLEGKKCVLHFSFLCSMNIGSLLYGNWQLRGHIHAMKRF